MKSDVIRVCSDGSNMESVLKQVEKIAAYKELSPQSTTHLRLLIEETMAMMRAITGNVSGEFWVEEEDGVYEIHLRVNTLMDQSKKAQLLAASSSGKNEAARGFMGKIRSFFEPTNDVPVFGAGLTGGAPQMYGNYVFAMEDYRDQLRQYREEHREGSEEAWDELEKSVVAHVADDVKVSIIGRTAELIIVKRME